MVATTSPISHRPGDTGDVIHRHGAVHYADYDWDERFEAMVARILADFIESYEQQRCESGLMSAKASIFLAKDRELKLRLEPGARGMGLGGQLIQDCIDIAREAGHQNIVLYTQSFLTPGRGLYKAAGFWLLREEGVGKFAPIQGERSGSSSLRDQMLRSVGGMDGMRAVPPRATTVAKPLRHRRR